MVYKKLISSLLYMIKGPTAKDIKKMGRNIYKATGLVNPVKKGQLSSSRLIKDVAMLKSIINSEKFRLETKIDGLGVGQLNGTGSGHYIVDVTPIPSQGDGYNNRQGNSIKLHASHYDFFFQKQTNSAGPYKVIIELWKVVGEPYSNVTSGIINKIFEKNQWIDNYDVFDTSSNRKQEQFKNFRCLRRKVVTIPASDYATQNIQKMTEFGIKYKEHHVKFNNNTNTLTNGQLIMTIRVDTGNWSTTVTGTADNVANNATSSALAFSWAKHDYYYDN